MFRDEKLELKVGLFIGVGIFLMFLIVFSISDFYLLKKGYDIRVIFDFVNGITEDAPVRLAGVHVGEVKKIDVYYDDTAGKTRVKLYVWIGGDTKIEEDAVARINTLGLLGEQYLEITPGISDSFLKPDDKIIGRNPVNVGQQMEAVSELVQSVRNIFQNAEKGEGTLGKLLVDDALYNDLATIFGRLSKGEGTIGKLLVEEKVYDDLEDFVSDIKAHPWKLLHKGSTGEKKSDKKKKRGTDIETR
jgi:phospholipid/cholesterol/gamma-HCH transport system substrate-binding protein